MSAFRPLGAPITSAAIPDGSVGLADLADLAQDTIIGRATASTGVPEAVPFKATARAVGAATSQAEARTAIGAGTSSLALSSDDPSPTGEPAAGVAATAARADHVHQLGDVLAENVVDSTPEGRAVLTGTPAAGREALGAAPSTGLVAQLPITGGSPTGDTTLLVVGRVRFDPADYAIDGLTTALQLLVVGDVSDGTCTVTLHNVTDASDVADVAITETTPTVKTDTVALPGAAKTYELRAQLTVGAAPDYWTIGGAVLRVSRS